MIEVSNLVKRFGDHTAVDHLDFTVEDGQIYGFLGPNGAGKTTTMNMMTGYIAATEGKILINGYDIMEEPAEAKKCIGYLPELPPLYMDMTVYEYLKFAAELKKIPKKEREEKITDVMEAVGITDMSSRLIKNLSKGYKQRVGLAQAIIGDPEVIILDEPTVGLDPKQIIEIRDLIKELGKKHTVILSSHILSEVSAVCDHIMIISHGKLVASDTPENLIKRTSGNIDIHLEIKGDMESTKAILKKCSSVDYVEANSVDKDKGTVTYTVHVLNDQDIREEIFNKMSKAKTPILEMVATAKSLEDIFLELTNDDTAAGVEEKVLQATGAGAADSAEAEQATGAGAEDSAEAEQETGVKAEDSAEAEQETGAGAEDSAEVEQETGAEDSAEAEQETGAGAEDSAEAGSGDSGEEDK